MVLGLHTKLLEDRLLPISLHVVLFLDLTAADESAQQPPDVQVIKVFFNALHVEPS